MKQLLLNDKQYQKALRSLYLKGSFVVRLPDDLYSNINLITAGCGRGKTTYATDLDYNGLLGEINALRRKNNLFDKNLEDIKAEEMTILVSRKTIKLQQLNNKNVIQALECDYSEEYLDFNNERKGKIRIDTAHHFGEMVRNGKVQKVPKIIVIDELHSIFSETIFADSLLYTIDFIKEHYAEMVKIGLTATPQFLLNYIKDDVLSFKVIDIDIGSRYKVKQTIKAQIKGSATTILKQHLPSIGSNYKCIVYIQSAKECYKAKIEFAEMGMKTAFLISDYNESSIDGRLLVDIMNEEGVKDYIINNQCFPKDIDIIFINSSCREGMNIIDEDVKMIICEAVDMITIEQILGRVRGDLEEFIVVCNYRNAEKVKKNIADLVGFLNELEIADNKRDVMTIRYGRQSENKNLQKFVYKYKNEYRVNNYAKAYLQYVYDSYLQIGNYKTNTISQKVGDRNLLLCEDYLAQLCRYAENGKIEIEKVWDVIIDINHQNAIEKFQKIEKEWLDKPLTAEDKRKIAETLNIIRSKGQKGSWKTVSEALKEGGYKITDGTKNIDGKRKRITIISK